MHRGIPQWFAWVLATALAAVSASAWGQESGDPDPANPATGPAATDPTVKNTVLVGEQKAGGDLAARVEELEKALKKVADKEAADKAKAATKPTVVLGGRMLADAVFFNQNAASRAALGDAQDSVFFRSLRLQASGEMFDVFAYKLEVDFAGKVDASSLPANNPSFWEQVAFKDIYLQVKELPLLGNVRVGHFKEPFSLDQLDSALVLTFMERNLADVFAPARNMGVMALDCNEEQTWTWAYGLFRQMDETPPFASNDNGGWAFTARTTWLPWYDEPSGGRGLLHLGMAYRFLDFDSATQRIRQRPETSVGPRVVDTGIVGHMQNVNEIGPELAFVYGPFSLQSEWIGAFYNRGDGFDNLYFNGYYVYASYFITGEHRTYNRREGRFDRIRPFENFFRVRTGDGSVATGMGAWELAYRYSNISLDDPGAGVLGGRANDHTLGLNWYLNPYSRLMWNYVHTNASTANHGPDVPMDILEMRAQFDF